MAGSKVKVSHLAHAEQSAGGRGVIREAGTLERVLGEGLAAALDFRDGQKLR